MFHQITHGFKDAADMREPAIALAARSVKEIIQHNQPFSVTIESKELERLFSVKFFFSWYTFQLQEESDYPFGLFSLFSNSIILEAFLTPLKHFELWPLTPIPPSFRVGIPRGGSCPKQV